MKMRDGAPRLGHAISGASLPYLDAMSSTQHRPVVAVDLRLAIPMASLAPAAIGCLRCSGSRKRHVRGLQIVYPNEIFLIDVPLIGRPCEDRPPHRCPRGIFLL